ncbi:hypothetical protein GXP70_12480 [Paenibacillus lycopersici]|uniref:Uncharacterized protein n=1 Tax=Paenibacillus lycopersici TaxID=2704462 RepID=A0A6C0FU52_9BACL|nr:hypothetical protein [Paenibacillus lycopersici]QHT60676.1 hypothetical protein GXP70_12480 [Paenibacillus lycopersici]
MYDLVLEMAHAVWKNGLSLSALGTAVYVLLKQRKVKRALRRLLPWLLEDDSDIKPYIANQLIIMENQRRALAALGVEAVCPQNAVTSPTSSGFLRALRTFFTYSWLGRSPARDAAGRNSQSITHSTISNRRKKQMKKWLKADSLTVIGGALAAAVSRYFGVEIDPANILAAAILLLGYFKAHEYVTVVRGANGLPTGFSVNSRKFIFTAIAFGLIVADELLKLNLSNELIITITAAVTGYNYTEGTKDAKQAEQEGADARQTH